VIEGGIRRDPPGPGTERAPRIEPGASPVDAPERLDREVLGYAAIPDDAHDPAEHRPLELPEERLEGVEIAPREALEDVRGSDGLDTSALDPGRPRVLPAT
jgi:hypothetical protein